MGMTCLLGTFFPLSAVMAPSLWPLVRKTFLSGFGNPLIYENPSIGLLFPKHIPLGTLYSLSTTQKKDPTFCRTKPTSLSQHNPALTAVQVRRPPCPHKNCHQQPSVTPKPPSHSFVPYG